MKLKNPLLAVADPEASAAFYHRVLGLHVIADLGANKTLTGGLALQSLESWREFSGAERVAFGGCDAELYFEEEDFDGFLNKLEGLPVTLLHPAKEHPWGQRAVRFYDPDRHIIEVGESLEAVWRRCLAGGMTPEQAAQRMGIPARMAAAWMRKQDRKGD